MRTGDGANEVFLDLKAGRYERSISGYRTGGASTGGRGRGRVPGIGWGSDSAPRVDPEQPLRLIGPEEAEPSRCRAYPISKRVGAVQRTSLNRVLADYQARTGKSVEVTRVPLEEVRARVQRDKGNIKSYIQLLFELDGTYGKEEEMNVDWPEFGPQGVVDAILSYKA
ncbi:hypothetical protein CALVIDRAFT_529421 [Calocera viscosa TUFC12733]|uniref:Uncharacterized protein n=1 Tax=Calocera viscosa (strain TUFC12733) TaxID=1330018 RepID=A0A167JBX0_CALVF|nr:hypothetical protein CALVIDRAFT_529421 [Calocera viscosa TUFC12733]